MSAEVYSRGLYLGETIQEKTRSLLGWNNEHCPSMAREPQVPSIRRRSPMHHSTSRRHPYTIPCGRVRKSSSSSSSTCSEYSQPSPSYSIRSYPESLSPEPMPYVAEPTPHQFAPYNPAFRSAEREARVFERLRQLVPVLPSDHNAYQVLIDTVSQVMDLEHQLEQLNEQTEDVKNILRLEGNYSDYDDCVFPDDLQSVDVSAFKHLLRSDLPSSTSPLNLNTFL
uniref:BHLH domain-containing protein n=1 Tax=Ascaris lumbricoides TaxID=6252 RepID=A0A0M3HT28_ASCLU